MAFKGVPGEMLTAETGLGRDIDDGAVLGDPF